MLRFFSQVSFKRFPAIVKKLNLEIVRNDFTEKQGTSPT